MRTAEPADPGDQVALATTVGSAPVPGPTRASGRGQRLVEAMAASGEVGRDLAALDWAAHPLGHPDNWPRSLGNAVRTMLASKFSMWLAWGEELTFFCNDAYRRDTLGTKYPWALGRPASQVWQEIWPDIGPRIERVITTGVATWDERLLLYLERSGYLEETYHTFSYSPLTDDEDRIVGMLCVVSEDTERVVGESRMRTLRDLAADPHLIRKDDDVFTAAWPHLLANPRSLPFTLCYLFEPDPDDTGIDPRMSDPRLSGPGLHRTWDVPVPTARLVCATHLAPGHVAAPVTVLPGDPATWPLGEAAQGRELLVENLAERFPGLPHGPLPLPSRAALVVPLAGRGVQRPYGALIVGLNRFRPLDQDYRGFVRLIARHLAAGVATARDYQGERRRAEALAELDRAKTAFFTNVSHEFRTPLTLLLGPAEDALADDQAPLPPGQRDRVELIQRNAARLLKLVNTLLDFSRLQSGRVEAHYEPTDLGRYTAELASMFRPAFTAAELALDVHLPAEADLQAHVDREMWAKIVLNLLSNALKHTFEGGVRVRLTGRAQEIRLDVTDTGVGIEEHDQARLFERFHRVVGARARSHEGSGIGLALVAELAALHGGGVGVTSEPGRGSTFTVTVRRGTAHLPKDQVVARALLSAATATSPGTLRPGDDGAASLDSAPLDGGSPSTPAAGHQLQGYLTEALRWTTPNSHRASTDHGGRVLVVDDNADMRDYVQALLADQYEVETAGDGLAALRLIEARRPDLVLSDVMMPELDGFGLLAALREDPRNAGLPVILLSARAGDDAAVEGLDAGADDYLVKPFSARELRARVRAHLDLRRSRQVTAELQRNRVLLDQAQRLAGVGSWEVDLTRDTLTVSQEFARQVGRSVEQVQEWGVREAFRALVHPEDAPTVAAALQAAGRGAPFDLECRLVAADGSVRRYRAVAEPAPQESGDLRIRGSIQDVTEQHRTLELQAAAAAAREAASREHRIAEELQRSLLPEHWAAPDHLSIATYYRAGVAGTHVGGDWYDVIELGAGRAALVIGDVMGRGVRAAAVMGQLRSAVRAFARLDLPPADLLELLDGVVRDLGEDHIVTCIYGVYDPGERSFTYANAGHLPPLLRAPGRRARPLGGTAGPPLGTGPFTLDEHRVRLSPGTTLALYTDGLVERRDIDIDAGVEALATALDGYQHQDGDADDPSRLIAGLLPDGPDDDIALLLVRVTDGDRGVSSYSWAIEENMSAVRRARDLVAGALATWQVPQSVACDVVLVVSELVTNALLHAQPPVMLRLRMGGSRIVVEVHDRAPFLPRKLRPGPEDEHGRGLQLTAHLTERWGTRPIPDGKAVWCVFTLPGAPPVRDAT